MSQGSFNQHDARPQAEAETEWSLKGVGRHALGLFLLLGVVILWTLQNFLASAVFANDAYAKPFFFNYLNASLFVLMFIPGIVRMIHAKRQSGTLRSSVRSFSWRRTVRKFVTGRDTTNHHLLARSQCSERSALLRRNLDYGALSAVSTSTSDSASFRKAAVSKVTSADDDDDDNDREEYFDTVLTARLALCFCPIWFGASYLASASLVYTTVSSQSIISSTSSVWCLLVGAVSGIEKFTWRKLCGTLFVFAGIVITSGLDLTSGTTDEPDSVDVPSSFNHTFTLSSFTPTTISPFAFPAKPPAELALGDALALLSAMSYGVYTIILTRANLTAHPQPLHMPTFFSFVGLFICIFSSPLFPIFHATGFEPFALPPTRQIWAILLANGTASFASDFLWAYAMFFTSPLVCTVGLSLTIPMSLFVETVLMGQGKGVLAWIGGLVVVLGFVFVEREEVKEERKEKEEEEERFERSLQASVVLGVEPVGGGGGGGGGGDGDGQRDVEGSGGVVRERKEVDSVASGSGYREV